MPRPQRPLPSALRRAPFAVADAERAGLSVRALRREQLRTPTPGVRSAGPAPRADDLRQRCREFVPVLPPGAVFCHVTALALLGVDLPLGVDASGDLHVQVGPAGGWPRRRGLAGHRRTTAVVGAHLLPGDVPVLLPELAWVQVAPGLPPRERVVLADALMRRRARHCSPEQLERAVAALPAGARGARGLRTAHDLARPGTDSCMKSRLRWHLVDAGLPCPEVNALVRDGAGRVVAMPDLSYPDLRIAVEYDGDVHRTDARTWRRDITRRQELEALGWRVISCTADDVLRTPDRPVTWVRAACERRAAR